MTRHPGLVLILAAVLLALTRGRLRAGGPAARTGASDSSALGMPLLQLERVTFHYVEAGLAVPTATRLPRVSSSATASG